MTLSQSQNALANVCLFCGDKLSKPSMCTYCGFKFCDTHKSIETHQCIKTRYSEYIRKTNPNVQPNISTGKFRLVCDVCGFSSSTPAPIEYSGEELIQHTQIVGCTGRVFLEEVKNVGSSESDTPKEGENKTIQPQKVQRVSESTGTLSGSNSIVDQIQKLSALKEKGMISDEEFSYIKKELIKKFSL